MTALNREWSRNLRDTRAIHGLTQVQVADACGVAFQTVSKWERGELLPKPLDQARLAGLYRTTVPMLFPVAPIAPAEEYAA